MSAPSLQGPPGAATDWRDALASVARGEVRRDEPLARHTTFGIGGPADLWIEPADSGDLAAVLGEARRLGVPWTIVGGGSNLLVADRGVRGLVVHLPAGEAPEETRPGPDGRVHAVFPAGLATGAVRRFARTRGLAGAEFLGGIPGSLGGALQMNAGTRLGEMKDVVVAAEVVLPDEVRWLPADAFGFAYRHAVLPAGGVVTRIELALRPADPAALAAAADAGRSELARRHATQPRGRSAGSLFKNPPGDHAGRLIEACGLKGRRIGGAVVSPVHANFVVNEAGATAADVRALAALCRDAVRARFGIELELEVRMLGEFE